MASKTYYFRGIINWAKVQKPDEKYDVYTLDLVLDEASYLMFKDSGAQLKERADEDGVMIKLRRPTSKKIKNEIVDMGPPQVLLKGEVGDDGKATYTPFGGLIGNGSVGVCKVRVYDTMKGKGHELVTVAVEDLVNFAGDETVNPDELPF